MNDSLNILSEKIVKLGNKYQVQSKKGRNMGTYDTKAEAEKRLQQVHYFKYKKEELIENIKKSFLEYCADRNIKYSLTNDGIELPTWRDYIKALDLLGDMRIPYKAFDGGNKQIVIDKKYLNEAYKEVYDTIWVYVENRRDGGGWNQELDVINNSISDTIKNYKNSLGYGYWINYSGPGKTHKADELKKENNQHFQQLSIFDCLDEKYITENIQPFELEVEKTRIRDILDILNDIEYGFVSQIDGSIIKDRDWIQKCDLEKYYKVNTNPCITIKNKLGICQDQAIVVKYLMNKYHPEDTVYLYAITKGPKGHCVPCYCHNNKWYYIENSWSKEKGLHGYFESQKELEKYLQFVYYENHKIDTPADSEIDLSTYTIPEDDNTSNLLIEDTRTALINKSRNAGDYRDKTHGKNRFERKKYSKVANAVKEYNQLDMNDFFKRDILTVKVPVQGETDSYTVSIKMEGVLAEIAKNVKSNKNKFEFRTAIQALTKIFNTGNVWVNCNCPDHRYNFSHWNIINNVSTEDTAHDPGPGKNIRNPKDDKGRGCKHVLLVLNNLSWLMNVASVIRNYILYAEDHMQKPFLKLIFPKIYGIPAEEMVEQDLIDDEKFLDSSKGLIDAINAYSAKRGIIPKGTNKNPAKGKGSIDLDKYNKKDEEKTDAKKDTH